MSEMDTELDSLFHDMASAAAPLNAADEARRRQRAIGGMRALERSLAAERSRKPRRPRRFVWVAAVAAAALCGTAFAASRGLLSFAPKARRAVAQVAQSCPAPTPAQAGARGAAVSPTDAGSSITSVAPPVPVARVVPTPVPAPHQREVKEKAEAQSAELEEVNRLFVEAKRARREHRDADALGLLQELLSKHGGSVLAHEAMVERFRALARLGRVDEARQSAAAYLARYPTGFAADEARTLTGTPP